LRDRGLRVLDVEVLRIRPDKPPDEALRILDAGAELNARYALVNCNDDDERRLADRFAEISTAAADRGLHLGLEFMIFTAVRTLTDALALLHRAGNAHDVIVLDALHLYRSGGTAADVAAAPADRLPYLQLCDAPTVGRLSDEDAMHEAPHRAATPRRRRAPAAQPARCPSTRHRAVGRGPRPVAKHANRPAAERAQLAYTALDRLLTEHAGHAGARCTPNCHRS
jgi:sugar phosphate isomerase/epimerase